MRSQKKSIITCGDQVAIESPCVRNCCLDQQDVCIGCGRTIEEIIRWGDADDKEKRQILAVAEKRKDKKVKW